MNLAGIPPLSGFLGKVGLLEAGVQLGTPLTYILVAGGVVTSLLTLYALVKAWNKAFWQTPAEERPPVRLPFGMVAPTAALIGVGLLLTVAAGPLYAYTDRAAVSLAERTPYIDAVLPDGERGQGVSDDVAGGASREPAPAPAPVAHPVADRRLADRRLGVPVGRPVRRATCWPGLVIGLLVTTGLRMAPDRLPRAAPSGRDRPAVRRGSPSTWSGRRSRSASSRCARATSRTAR